MTTDLRARSRGILRAELAAAAADFCIEHGYEDVTVDQIAQGIGISRATFFRYFASKDDAVVATVHADDGSLGDRLRAARPRAGTPAMDAVRASFAGTVLQARENPPRLRALFRMIDGSPALRARTAYARTGQRDALARALEEHLDDHDRARAVATVGMAILEFAWDTWTRDEEVDFGDALETAFTLVAGVGEVRLDR